MIEIYKEHQRILKETEESFRRAYLDRIDWEERLLLLLGARGVGKTTIMIQRIREEHAADENVLFVSMDDLTVADYRLVDIAAEHYNNGGTHLFVDEVHKYENWSQELKNINDKFRKLKVVASGSSILEIQKGSADLSRRAVIYIIKGLSFREYLNIESELCFPNIDLKEILKNHTEIAHEITKKVRPIQYLNDYQRHGYYPFYLEGKQSFHRKLNSAVNQLLEVDMPLLLGTDVGNIGKVKKLLYLLTVQAPFTPNISKLAERMGIDRKTLTYYIHYLEKSSILNLLWAKGKSHSILQKPDKILLDNSNLFYMTRSDVNVGTLRESFFVTQLSFRHEVELAKEGDFWVDGEHLFEVGGKGKSYKQIANLPESYVVIDGTEIGVMNKIPLWLFGFVE